MKHKSKIIYLQDVKTFSITTESSYQEREINFLSYAKPPYFNKEKIYGLDYGGNTLISFKPAYFVSENMTMNPDSLMYETKLYAKEVTYTMVGNKI